MTLGDRIIILFVLVFTLVGGGYLAYDVATYDEKAYAAEEAKAEIDTERRRVNTLAADHLRYMRDPKTGFCFAFVNYSSRPDLTYVPCTDAVLAQLVNP